MTRYQICLSHILQFEGGYVNDPQDKGGATKYGITEAVDDAYDKEHGIPDHPVYDIPIKEVEDIYKEKYWDKCRCFDIPSPLDLVVFDSAVQHGTSRASKWLQHCVGTFPDGIIGDKTIYALHGKVLNNRLQEIIENYINGRIAFYAQIIVNDPTQKKFSKGWKNRIDALQQIIK